MPNKNECNFSGHIARPLEKKTSKSGKSWGKMTVAVSQGKKGDPNAKVAWVSITLFGDKADEAATYGKGDIAEFEKLQYNTDTLHNEETGEKKTFHSFALPPWGSVTFSKKGQYSGKHETPKPAEVVKEPDEEINLPF